jgi:hypothetical protein
LLEGPLEGLEAGGVGFGAALGVGAEGAEPEAGVVRGDAGLGVEEGGANREEAFEVFLEPDADGLVGFAEVEEFEVAGFDGSGGFFGLFAGDFARAEHGGVEGGEGAAGDVVEGGGAVREGLVEGGEDLFEEGFPSGLGLGVEFDGEDEGVAAVAVAQAVDEVGFSIAGAGGAQEDDAALALAYAGGGFVGGLGEDFLQAVLGVVMEGEGFVPDGLAIGENVRCEGVAEFWGKGIGSHGERDVVRRWGTFGGDLPWHGEKGMERIFLQKLQIISFMPFFFVN